MWFEERHGVDVLDMDPTEVGRQGLVRVLVHVQGKQESRAPIDVLEKKEASAPGVTRRQRAG